MYADMHSKQNKADMHLKNVQSVAHTTDMMHNTFIYPTLTSTAVLRHYNRKSTKR